MSTTEAVPAFSYKRLPLTADGKLIKTTRSILQSPRSQVIISFPKTGKTDSMMDRSKFFIGDAEGGTDKFEGNNSCDLTRFEKDSCYMTKTGIFYPAGLYETCQELYRANRMKEFNMLNQRFKETRDTQLYQELVVLINEMPFPIFVTDTLTHFMKLVYEAALMEYNNGLTDTSKWKTDIRRVDNYSGAQYIRRKLEEVKLLIERNAAPFIIYNGHVKLKKAVLNKSDEDINVLDLALEGQLPLIFTSSAEAVGVFTRTADGCFLDYTKRSDEDMDARPRHLGNRKIKISELHDYELDAQGGQHLKKKGQTYWERIYPEIQF